jgi:hydroxymethylglutaryl-CoA lyase
MNIFNRSTRRLMHSHSRTRFEQKCIASSNRQEFQPILFDVSLRDGIQGANPLDYPTNKKIEIMRTICNVHSPQKIEIGSFVSPKVLPIMSDTEQLLKTASTIFRNTNKTADIYALVPNKTGLLNAIKGGFTNFSFITSVSNAFQIKNTGKNILYKKTELQDMMEHISQLKTPAKTKLYISCINECPLTGLIDNDTIIYEILSSYGKSNSPIECDEICLSDTMGTLLHRDFEYIVGGLIRFGVPKSKISVHLHINQESAKEAKLILFKCFDNGLNRFDVSAISEGGCSVTMNSNQLKSNMTYEFFHNALEEWKSL